MEKIQSYLLWEFPDFKIHIKTHAAMDIKIDFSIILQEIGEVSPEVTLTEFQQKLHAK